MKVPSTEELQLIGSGAGSSIYKLQESECEEGLVFKIVSTSSRKEA